MKKVLYILGELSAADVEWMLRVGHKKRTTPSQVLIKRDEQLDALYVRRGREL